MSLVSWAWGDLTESGLQFNGLSLMAVNSSDWRGSYAKYENEQCKVTSWEEDTPVPYPAARSCLLSKHEAMMYVEKYVYTSQMQ